MVATALNCIPLSPKTTPVKEAVFVLMPKFIPVVDTDGRHCANAEISQTPAVKVMLVIFATVLVVKPADVACDLICSPINPAGGAVFVLFPFNCKPVVKTEKFVVSILGTPEEFVDKTPEFAVARPETTLVAEP